MGKACPTKQTAARLNDRIKAATQNAGGGNAGLKDRMGGAAGSHAKFACPMCGINTPSEKSGQAHWESKHPKQPFVWVSLSIAIDLILLIHKHHTLIVYTYT